MRSGGVSPSLDDRDSKTDARPLSRVLPRVSSELITVGQSGDSSCLVETQSSTKTVVNTESGSGKTVLQTIIQVVTQSASTESADVGKK